MVLLILTFSNVNSLSSSITGSAVSRANGGGINNGANGTTNKGNGGSGSANNSGAGSGGSGIVIIRYVTSQATISIGAGLGYSQSTSGDETIIQFTSGTGTITFS